MNNHSKAQLQELAIPHFQKLGVKTLHATGDGQFFILQNRALLHANGKQSVYELHFEGEGETGDEMPTISELKLMVETVTDLNELKTMMHQEVAADNRTEAVEVIMARLEQLTEGDKPEVPVIVPEVVNPAPVADGTDPAGPLTVGGLTQAIANTSITTEENPPAPAALTPAAKKAATPKKSAAQKAAPAKKTAPKK